ncbi:hypothetical protein DXG01_004358 [Tephrocybe rancida]|nr:hypothetical protein DXG01_004358 [Tephrocybe rancida]
MSSFNFGKRKKAASSSTPPRGGSPDPTSRAEVLRNLAAVHEARSPLTVEWVLNADFLNALSIWDRNHPQSTLDRVLNKISSAIDKGQPFVGLIPDAPFPAQSLVKSLAHLLQLGVMLSKADLKLQDFALSVAQWLTDLKKHVVALGSNESASLPGTRKLTALEADGRWSKSDVDSEIAEFKTLVNEARQIFHDRSLITITESIIGLKQESRGVLHCQNLIHVTLEKIVTAHKAQEAEIAAELARKEVVHQALGPHTAAQSMYDQQGKIPCDEGTRVEVLEAIRCWVYDHSEWSQNFLWLTGDPGCGKSTITTTIAQECKDKSCLWAQFFINRNLAETTDPSKYFPTIARQLSGHSKGVEHHVYDTVVEKRSIADRMTADQAAKLFISALAKASNINKNTPVLVVIDGLDETNRDHLYDTAEIFSQLFETLSNHRNVKILISSRIEHEIHEPFTQTLKNLHVRHLHLDTADPFSLRDVDRYLKEHLHKIAIKNKLDPTQWPGDEHLNRLSEQASGLFIWAATVVKFLDARIRKRGKEDLYRVLEQLDLPEKADINTLYTLLLKITYDDDSTTEDWDLEIFRRLMGAIAVAREPLSIAHLDDLLDLRYTPTSNRVDVQNFVQLLRTVLVSGVDVITETTIVRFHKSFVEYITSKNAAERFRVNLETANAELALCCLHHLVKLYASSRSTHFAATSSDVKAMSYPARYALRFCVSHVPQRNSTLGIVCDDPVLKAPVQCESLITCSANILQIGPLSVSLQVDPSFITTSLDEHSLFWNVKDGSSTTPVDIPYDTLEALEVTFSPDGSRFCAVGRSSTIWWDMQSLRRSNSRSHRIDETGLMVYGVWFSHKRNIYATAGGPPRVHGCLRIELRDTDTGQEIQNSFEVPVGLRIQISLAFAPDDIHLAVVCNESIYGLGAIEIWNILTGQLERVIQEDGMYVSATVPVVISSDGTWILSLDDYHRLILWDFHTGKRIGEPLQGPSAVTSMAISTDINYFVSGSEDGFVCLWDAKTRRPLGVPWKCRASVERVVFSPDGHYFFSLGENGLDLWATPTGQALAFVPSPLGGLRGYSRFRFFSALGVFSPDGQHALTSHPGHNHLSMVNVSPHAFHIKPTFKVKWTALSIPNGNLIVSVCSDNTLRLSKLDAVREGGRRLEANDLQVPFRGVAFSPDERYIAGACKDGKIHLWSAGDCSLVATYHHDITRGFPSLSFTHDGAAIVVTSRAEKYLLTLVDSQLTHSNDTPSIQLASSSIVQNYNTPPHVYNSRTARNRRLETVRWFPSNSDTVLWAYVDNHIIRAGTDGKFVIVPVDEGLKA